MSTIICENILSSNFYNKISDIDNFESFDENLLKEIGNIFIKYDMHHFFGLSLLHKHFVIKDGYIMLHENLENKFNVQTLKPVKINMEKMYANSYMVKEDGNLIGYEYKREHTVLPKNYESFIKEFSNFMLKNKLEKIFSLTEISKNNERLIEFNDNNVCFTISEKYCDKEVLKDYCNFITTNWYFNLNNGIIEVKGDKVCAEMKNGNHRVFINSKLKRKIINNKELLEIILNELNN